MKSLMKFTAISNVKLLIILLLIATNVQGQDWYGWVMPRESQQASVTQRIGVTDITVSYHRPDVKGRKLWGDLIPYDKVWRAGANNATTINFSTNVFIEGKELKAGSYGFFILPTEKEWTVIFNKTSAQWGAYTYDENQDALRVSAKPEIAEFTESLLYSFPALTDSSTTLVMNWVKVRLPIKISVNLSKTVKAKVNTSINYQSALFAMLYYSDVLKDFDEALKWANVSLALQENQAALTTKAEIYNRKGEYKEALAVAMRALEVRKRDLPKMSTKNLDDLIKELRSKQ